MQRLRFVAGKAWWVSGGLGNNGEVDYDFDLDFDNGNELQKVRSTRMYLIKPTFSTQPVTKPNIPPLRGD